jgi:hypothetical protein
LSMYPVNISLWYSWISHGIPGTMLYTCKP